MWKKGIISDALMKIKVKEMYSYSWSKFYVYEFTWVEPHEDRVFVWFPNYYSLAGKCSPVTWINKCINEKTTNELMIEGENWELDDWEINGDGVSSWHWILGCYKTERQFSKSFSYTMAYCKACSLSLRAADKHVRMNNLSNNSQKFKKLG